MSTYKSLIAVPLWIVAGLLGLNLFVAVQPDAEAGSAEGPPTGACCLPGDACVPNLTESDCFFGAGGSYQGNGTTCGGALCGACCLPDDTCIGPNSPDVCAAMGGAHVPDLACSAVDCQATVCPHDVDGDGIVGIVDFLDLLGSWGACP